MLFNIVYRAIQLPLYRHFHFTPKAEFIQPFVAVNIPKTKTPGKKTENKDRHQSTVKFQLPFKPLSKLEDNANKKKQMGILFSAVDYLELADYIGRIVKEGKHGVINQLTPPMLKRLNLNTDEWLARASAFEENYY